MTVIVATAVWTVLTERPFSRAATAVSFLQQPGGNNATSTQSPYSRIFGVTFMLGPIFRSCFATRTNRLSAGGQRPISKVQLEIEISLSQPSSRASIWSRTSRNFCISASGLP